MGQPDGLRNMSRQALEVMHCQVVLVASGAGEKRTRRPALQVRGNRR